MEWYLNVKRPLPLRVLDGSLILRSDLFDLRHFTGVAYSQAFYVIRHGMVEFYTPVAETTSLVGRLRRDLTRTLAMIGRWEQYYQVAARALRDFDQVKLSGAAARAWSGFGHAYRALVTYRVTTRVLGYAEDLPAGVAKTVADTRMEFQQAWTQVRQELRRVLAAIAQHYGVPLHTVTLLTDGEFARCLRRRSFAGAVAIARRRSSLLVLYGRKRRVRLLSGPAVIRFLDGEFPAVARSDVRQLHGRCAYRGKVRGVVRVLLRPQRVPAGRRFVLVTPMTTPQFVPLLGQASAIVTDEGGVTCHAAVIARELKKPCVIGTKIATQVLKDGDRVEVDAVRGVVKILKTR